MVPERLTDVSPQPSAPRGPRLCDASADLDAAIKKLAFSFHNQLHVFLRQFRHLLVHN